MLTVDLGSARVGAIRRRANRRTEFTFDREYLDLADRPVLGRWFEDHIGPDFVCEERGDRLMPFFRSCLPDVASALRRFIAAEASILVADDWSFFRHVGQDLPGAVVITETEEDEPPRPPHDASTEVVHVGAQSLGFSLGGLQLKYSMLRDGERFTLPMKGQGGRWIVKCPDANNPRLPEVELATLQLAKACGITVPEARAVATRDLALPNASAFVEPTALALRRFDRRDDGTRIHQEDFAQVLNREPEDKYVGSYFRLGKLVHDSCGAADFDEFVRRVAFAVLVGNADAHLKNWSLTYENPKRPRLSPAYDLVPVVVYREPEDRLALDLGGDKRFASVTRESFVKLANHAGADATRALLALDAVTTATRAQLSHDSGGLPLTQAQAAILRRHVERLSL